jgi:putative ATP-dependent endonuclease of OLD family
VEHCFWQHGYAQVYQAAAGMNVPSGRKAGIGRVIGRAIKRHSKPYMAFQVLGAATSENAPGVPAPLRHTIETCVQLARQAPEQAIAAREAGPRHHGRHHGHHRRRR